MADSTPIEKLQPCLLDRLTDDEPQEAEEGRSQRVISHQRYRRGVLRDLEWLFNTNAFLQLPGNDEIDLRDYPEAWRSVLNYGVRQLTGLAAPDMQRLQDDLAEALEVFEPRVSARTLSVHASMERNIVSFEIDGDLWANPLPEQLHVKTTVDLETGLSVLGDAANG
jgi:type VI secretion system protein ImpF